MAGRVKDKGVVWAIDVANVEEYGVLMDSEREVVVTVKWSLPAETPALLERLRDLPCESWLKPEACLVLIQQGTSVQKLDDGACFRVGKFDNRFKGVKLYIGKQFIVPYHQVVAYEIKD